MSKDGVKIFENSQWIAWDWGVEEIVEHSGSGYWMEKGNLKAEPQMYFDHVMVKSWVDPDLWLDKGNILADPKRYFDHVMEKTWVNPDLWFEAYEAASGPWGIDADIINDLKSSVPYHKERKTIYEEINQRMGGRIHGLFESDQYYKDILKENPQRYPILTKMEHGESE